MNQLGIPYTNQLLFGDDSRSKGACKQVGRRREGAAAHVRFQADSGPIVCPENISAPQPWPFARYLQLSPASGRKGPKQGHFWDLRYDKFVAWCEKSSKSLNKVPTLPAALQPFLSSG